MADDNGRNRGFCCGCCVGLAVGYLLWGGNNKTRADSHRCLDREKDSITEIVGDETVNEDKPQGLLLGGIYYYQRQISPQLKNNLSRVKLCKYEPSCSEYAKLAIEEHGSITGVVMSTVRLIRCNPWSGGGNDRVGTPWYARKIM